MKSLLKTIEKRDKSLIRDIKIDKILSNEQLSIESVFINEVRDHLSTVINRSLYTNKSYFNNPDIFHIEKQCDCNVIYQNEQEFIKSIQTIYLIYRNQLNMNHILTNEFIVKLKQK